MPPALIACAHCGCHAKSVESTCPNCGEPLRRKDGTIPRAAAAVLLGLTTVSVGALAPACGGNASAGSSSSASGAGGSINHSSAAAYGVASSTSVAGSGGSPAAAYGVAQTSSASSSGGKDGG